MFYTLDTSSVVLTKQSIAIEGAQTRPAERERERENGDGFERRGAWRESGGLTSRIAHCYFDPALSGLNTGNYGSARRLGGSGRRALKWRRARMAEASNVCVCGACVFH